MRGGDRGGGRDQGQQSQTNEPKMSIGVDAASNCLVVSATGPLLTEVEGVVAELDRRANMGTGEGVAVVTLKRTNPQAVQQSLSSIFGDMVQTTGGTSSTARRGTSSRGSTGGPAPDPRMEFFNRLRGGGGFGGFPGGGFPGGGFPGGGFPGGGPTSGGNQPGGGNSGSRGGRGR